MGVSVKVTSTDAEPPGFTVTLLREKTAVAAMLPAISPAGTKCRFPFVTTTSSAMRSKETCSFVAFVRTRRCVVLCPASPRRFTTAGASDSVPAEAIVAAKRAMSVARRRFTECPPLPR